MAEQGNCLGNLSRYLRKKSKGSKDDPNSCWYLTPVPEKGTDQLIPQYVTWPTEILHTTIHDLISAAGITDLVAGSEMANEIKKELNGAVPFEHKEQFDFCIVCPQIDFSHAKALKEKISAQFDLVGHVLWESVELGADLCDTFEDVLKRSTKVVFYVSENFDGYDFSCHLARNYLMEHGQIGSERNVIPILKNYDIEVPESFKLIDRLVLTNDLQFQFRFPVIFSEYIREKKELRRIQCVKETDDKRLAILNSLVQERVRNILHNNSQP